jgi:hypothetical protein
MDNEATNSNVAVVVLRWIALLPAALVAGVAAWMAVSWGNYWIFGLVGVNPHSFFNKLLWEVLPYGVLGVTVVWIAAKVAPSHGFIVAIATATLLVMAAIFFGVIGGIAQDWWMVYSSVAQIVRTAVGARSALATRRGPSGGASDVDAAT